MGVTTSTTVRDGVATSTTIRDGVTTSTTVRDGITIINDGVTTLTTIRDGVTTSTTLRNGITTVSFGTDETPIQPGNVYQLHDAIKHMSFDDEKLRCYRRYVTQHGRIPLQHAKLLSDTMTFDTNKIKLLQDIIDQHIV